jgi:hypothetical protein
MESATVMIFFALSSGQSMEAECWIADAKHQNIIQ